MNRCSTGGTGGQIELQRARLAARADDPRGDRLGGGDAAVSVHIHKMALRTQGPANARADRAAAARDQGSSRDLIQRRNLLPASSTTEARPASDDLSLSRKG